MIATVLVAFVLAATTAAEPPVRVTADVAAAADDHVVVLWTFDVADGWHLYGPHRNDSGQPPRVTWDLPAGWSAGPLEGWRRPERHVVADLILDHIYEDQLVLSQTVRHPPDAAARPLRADLRWLVCADLCVPGDTLLTVSLPAGAAAAAVARLNRLREETPAPLDAARYDARREADAVVIEAPGAARLEFVPEADGPPLAALVDDGAADGPRLRLRLDADAASADTLAGLLTIHHNDQTLTGTIAVPLATPEGDQP